MTSIRRAVVIAVSVLVLFLSAYLGLTALTAGRSDLTDADVVFCLSDDQRARLADSAVTLGLVMPALSAEDVLVDGGAVAVSQWRGQRPDDFARACSAIRPARTSPPSPMQTGLLATINVMVGVVLGFGSATLQQTADRARQNARTLRAAATAFLAAARGYAREWNGPTQPSDLAVQDRRSELMAELRTIEFESPNSPTRAALERLSSELSEQVFRQWRRQNAGQVDDQLRELETEVFRLANVIQHPWRNRTRLRGDAAGAGK